MQAPAVEKRPGQPEREGIVGSQDDRTMNKAQLKN
jgi:hypothetical protein